MSLQVAFQWVNDSPFSTAVRESEYLFPLFNAVHVIGICTLLGTIAVFDLRLLGILFPDERASTVARNVLPVVWISFVVAGFSGFVLLASEAARAYTNPAFWWKMFLLLIAGVNPLIFHFTVFRRVKEWDSAAAIPWNARAAGAASLLLWTSILIAGRAMAYF